MQRELEQPDIWNDPARAQALGQERSQLEQVVVSLDAMLTGLVEAADLLALAEEEDDSATVDEVVKDLQKFEQQLAGLEFRRMFSGEMDANSAFVDIQSGAGGTEAQDWAEMLLRMYLRWAEAHGFKAEVIEASAGEVAGIKSATLHLVGEYASVAKDQRFGMIGRVRHRQQAHAHADIWKQHFKICRRNILE